MLSPPYVIISGVKGPVSSHPHDTLLVVYLYFVYAVCVTHGNKYLLTESGIHQLWRIFTTNFHIVSIHLLSLLFVAMRGGSSPRGARVVHTLCALSRCSAAITVRIALAVADRGSTGSVPRPILPHAYRAERLTVIVPFAPATAATTLPLHTLRTRAAAAFVIGGARLPAE